MLCYFYQQKVTYFTDFRFRCPDDSPGKPAYNKANTWRLTDHGFTKIGRLNFSANAVKIIAIIDALRNPEVFGSWKSTSHAAPAFFPAQAK